MKSAIISIRLRNFLLGVLASMMIFSFTSSITKTDFSFSPLVPSARGYAKVEKSGMKIFNINIRITGLPEVNRLQPPRRAYVVWMVSDQFITKNLGQLHASRADFRGKLKTSFESTSSIRPAKIFITAEDDPSLDRPGTQVVMATNKF